jgi:hypothetical protein
MTKVISDKRLDQLLAASPAERVTPDFMKSRIRATEFLRVGQTVTLCNLTLDNNFSVRGESACVNAANYNKEIGEKVAYDNAFVKLWPLFGFLLAEKTYLGAKADAA